MSQIGPDRTDLARLRALTDEEIERAVKADPDAAPILDAAWFAAARAAAPPEKEMISIRIDKAVLDFFRSLGPGYQTRINATLRTFVEHAPKTKKIRSNALHRGRRVSQHRRPSSSNRRAAAE